MREHPDLKVLVSGHTDVRNPNDYNTVLSYKRAKSAIDYLVGKYNVPRDRFVLQYGGEDKPLVDELPDNHQTTREQERMQYMNRRVEFRVAGADDQEMGVPQGSRCWTGYSWDPLELELNTLEIEMRDIKKNNF